MFCLSCVNVVTHHCLWRDLWCLQKRWKGSIQYGYLLPLLRCCISLPAFGQGSYPASWHTQLLHRLPWRYICALWGICCCAAIPSRFIIAGFNCELPGSNLKIEPLNAHQRVKKIFTVSLKYLLMYAEEMFSKKMCSFSNILKFI